MAPTPSPTHPALCWSYPNSAVCSFCLEYFLLLFTWLSQFAPQISFQAVPPHRNFLGPFLPVKSQLQTLIALRQLQFFIFGG